MYCCTATRTTDAVERVCEDIPILKAEYVCCAAGGFFYWERNVDILSVSFFSSLARSSREKSVSSVVSCGSGAEMKTSASFISGREISSLLWTRVEAGGEGGRSGLRR